MHFLCSVNQSKPLFHKIYRRQERPTPTTPQSTHRQSVNAGSEKSPGPPTPSPFLKNYSKVHPALQKKEYVRIVIFTAYLKLLGITYIHHQQYEPEIITYRSYRYSHLAVGLGCRKHPYGQCVETWCTRSAYYVWLVF